MVLSNVSVDNYHEKITTDDKLQKTDTYWQTTQPIILQPYFSQSYVYTDPDKMHATSWICDSPDSLTDEFKYLDNVFNQNNYNRGLIKHNTYRNSEPNATNTDAGATYQYYNHTLHERNFLMQGLVWYSPTTSALLPNLSLLYDSYWRTLKTKTNRATDREQFIKSNAATARPLILVRPAEIWTSEWLTNTDERLEMVISTITMLSTI